MLTENNCLIYMHDAQCKTALCNGHCGDGFAKQGVTVNESQHTNIAVSKAQPQIKLSCLSTHQATCIHQVRRRKVSHSIYTYGDSVK